MVETLNQNRIQEKMMKRNGDNLRDLWDNIKCTTIRIIDSTFFSSAYGNDYRIDRFLGHKSSLRKF